MRCTTDRDEVRRQAVILAAEFSDYRPQRHDAFVIRHNRDTDARAMEAYIQSRGIVGHNEVAK